MELRELRGVYEGEGPFATVYMEGRSPAEDSAQQVRLRWEELRRRLSEEGAPETVLSALDETVLVDEPGELQSNGRVIVADASAVLLDEAWDAALGAGDAAHLADEPALGAYVRERERSVDLLVAIADQRGAVVRQLRVGESHTTDQHAEETIGGESESVHKPREGALSHKQIQRRADEVVKQNVREVAEHLTAVAAKQRPDLLVLAGEVQGRTALRDELPPALQDRYVEVEDGGVSDDGAEEALEEALRSLAAETGDTRAVRRREQFEQARAHGLAVEGAEPVAQAVEMGAVEALLLEYKRMAEAESHLLAESARTDSEAALVDAELGGAIGAILRFEISGPSL